MELLLLLLVVGVLAGLYDGKVKSDLDRAVRDLHQQHQATGNAIPPHLPPTSPHLRPRPNPRALEGRQRRRP